MKRRDFIKVVATAALFPSCQQVEVKRRPVDKYGGQYIFCPYIPVLRPIRVYDAQHPTGMEVNSLM